MSSPRIEYALSEQAKEVLKDLKVYRKELRARRRIVEDNLKAFQIEMKKLQKEEASEEQAEKMHNLRHQYLAKLAKNFKALQQQQELCEKAIDKVFSNPGETLPVDVLEKRAGKIIKDYPDVAKLIDQHRKADRLIGQVKFNRVKVHRSLLFKALYKFTGFKLRKKNSTDILYQNVHKDIFNAYHSYFSTKDSILKLLATDSTLFELLNASTPSQMQGQMIRFLGDPEKEAQFQKFDRLVKEIEEKTAKSNFPQEEVLFGILLSTMTLMMKEMKNGRPMAFDEDEKKSTHEAVKKLGAVLQSYLSSTSLEKSNNKHPKEHKGLAAIYHRFFSTSEKIPSTKRDVSEEKHKIKKGF